MPIRSKGFLRKFFIFAIIYESRSLLMMAAPTIVQPIASNAASRRHNALCPLDCLPVDELSPRQSPQTYDSQSTGYSIFNSELYSVPYGGSAQPYGQNEYLRGGLYGIGNLLNQPYAQSRLNYENGINNGYRTNNYGNGDGAFGGSGYSNKNFGSNENFPASYAYIDNHGQYSMSNYEGGYNSYSQPGISYLPHYSDNKCRDRSADCALLASTGQCRCSLSTRVLCPLSCATNCASAKSVGDSVNTAFDQITTSLSAASDAQIGGLADGFLLESSSNIFPKNLYMRYQQQQQPLPFRGYGNGIGAAGYGTFDYGSQRTCIDSHIQGCVNWAQLGYCNLYPEFMFNYCKVSCKVCHPQIRYADAVGNYLDENDRLSYSKQSDFDFGIGGPFHPHAYNFNSINKLGLGGLAGFSFNDLDSDLRLYNPFISRTLFNPKNMSALLSINRVGLNQEAIGNRVNNPFQSSSTVKAGNSAIGYDAATAVPSKAGRSKSDSIGTFFSRLKNTSTTTMKKKDSDMWRLRAKAFDSINAPRDAPLKANAVHMDDLWNS